MYHIPMNILTIKLKSELSDLQKQGWWTENEEGEVSKNGTGTGLIELCLFATENILDDDRVATLTLRARNQENGYLPRTYTIRQLHPFWDANNEYGSERIEEYPEDEEYRYGVPWGPFWEYTGEGTPTYTIRYELDDFKAGGEWWESKTIRKLIARIYYEWGGGSNSEFITRDGNFTTNAYIVNYGVLVEQLEENTSHETSGLSNMSSGLTTQMMATTDFQSYLDECVGNSVDYPFIIHNYSNSAFMLALKKNKIKFKKESTSGVDVFVPDITESVSAGYINWYLPAKLECKGVYYNNPIAHECETNLGAGNGFSSVFWTSTSESSEAAWTYKYASDKNGENESIGKDQLCRVRAVRQK